MRTYFALDIHCAGVAFIPTDLFLSIPIIPNDSNNPNEPKVKDEMVAKYNETEADLRAVHIF
jgi:hypothetical protein